MLFFYKNSFYKVAILNITPDSFSDGRESFSVETFREKLLNFSYSTNIIFDIGAQSTAPSAVSISSAEEIKRFEQVFFPNLEDSLVRGIILNSGVSIDTFRPETFLYVLNHFKKIKLLPASLIWNDVSGKFDSEVINILRNEEIHYIFSHNLASSRSETPNHRSFVSNTSNIEFVE